MEDLGCPRCKTTKYRVPSLKLMVNSCGHALCSTCIELLFIKGSAACPECGVILRKGNFREQLFEDVGVEKEVDIRRRILKDFSKRESDFETLREYNDYLEEVETIIFNLANNIDILETNKRIERYKAENQEQIKKSRGRPKEELLELEAILEEEKLHAEQSHKLTRDLEKEEKIRKLKNKEALIDDLMFLDSDASSIVAQYKAESNAESSKEKTLTVPPAVNGNGTKFQTTSKTAQYQPGSGTSRFLPIPKITEDPLFVYTPLEIEFSGPNVPALDEFDTSPSNKYLKFIKAANVAERAGGFHSKIACRKALLDAFSDIAYQPRVQGLSGNPFRPQLVDEDMEHDY